MKVYDFSDVMVQKIESFKHRGIKYLYGFKGYSLLTIDRTSRLAQNWITYLLLYITQHPDRSYSGSHII